MKRSSIIFTLIAAILLTLVTTSPVLAHAELDRSLPEAESTVKESPEKVELWFTEEVATGSKIEVTDAAGNIVHEGEAEIDLMDPERKHLTIGLKAGLPSGVYTVTWTTNSAGDDHEASGSFTFTIEGSGTPVASPVASPVGSPIAKTSGTLLQAPEPPEAEPADIDSRAIAIAVGAGVLAALFIYGFWRLVRPRRHPFDRTGK
jgi:methionine-rich copper-binding protein CopC